MKQLMLICWLYKTRKVRGYAIRGNPAAWCRFR